MQELREQLSDLGMVLEHKQEEIGDLFSNEQLRAYFRCLDSLRLLIPNLYELEIALYENKILM